MIVTAQTEYLIFDNPTQTAKDFIAKFGSLMAIVVTNDLVITSKKSFWNRVLSEIERILSNGK